jgi:lipoprotein-anchoring transpeptidase ErfK/SrfK
MPVEAVSRRAWFETKRRQRRSPHRTISEKATLRTLLLSAAAAFLFMAGCQAGIGAERAAGRAGPNATLPEAQRQVLAAQTAGQRRQERARPEVGAISFLVDKSDRQLRVYRNGELFRTHAVAVGAPRWETPNGHWTFQRVDINPEWIPPDSPWARGEPRAAPGDPQNPMGRARLVFDMPYTIHGTDDLDSLGTAASHGSIRVANQHVIPLAELLLKAGGVWNGRSWFDNMVRNRTVEFEIELRQPVPIEVRE